MERLRGTSAEKPAVCRWRTTMVLFSSLCFLSPALRTTADMSDTNSQPAEARPVYKDYIIVGAGPAGLQMGYLLHKANRDYVILDRHNVSGSFFLTYPRHDRLNSINKRHTGRSNTEFNMRHDWNSLLSDDPGMLFTRYSKQFFPNKTELHRYLNDYANRWRLHVIHDAHVTNITRARRDADTEANSTDLFFMWDQRGQKYICRTLIIATGLARPNVPNYPGIDLAEGYESISTDPRQYEGKRVLILGHGNAAFETAENIYGAASLVHVVGRNRVRLAWETHYVGDVRGMNNGVLDTYQLKSLDGVVEGALEDLSFQRDVHSGTIRVGLRHGHTTQNFALRTNYDVLIRCLGFTFEDSIFDSSTLPPRGEARRNYPVIDHDHQVAGVPGMYIIGAAAHSLDYRKSAGGFIHGFRYTTRVVHRLLEYINHINPWPSVTLPHSDMLNHVIKRINEGAAIYQMFGGLGDVIVLREDGPQFEYFEDFPVRLLPEFTARTGRPLGRCIVVLMQYGDNYSGPGKDVFAESRAEGQPHIAHKSNFLHPVLYYYDQALSGESFVKELSSWAMPRPTRLHHVAEDFLTTWNAARAHTLPLRRFLEYATHRDLRSFTSDDCFRLGLTHQASPLYCQTQYLTDGNALLTDDVMDVNDIGLLSSTLTTLPL